MLIKYTYDYLYYHMVGVATFLGEEYLKLLKDKGVSKYFCYNLIGVYFLFLSETLNPINLSVYE